MRTLVGLTQEVDGRERESIGSASSHDRHISKPRTVPDPWSPACIRAIDAPRKGGRAGFAGSPKAAQPGALALVLLLVGGMETRKRAVAILSDQILFREGLKELLHGNGFAHIAEFSTTSALLDAARTRAPDIVIIDIDHEREDIVLILRALRRALLDSQILVIGSALRQAAAEAIAVDADIETPSADSRALLAAAELGARTKPRSPEALRLRRRWAAITPRQRDVLRWMSTGSDNRTIARKLRIGERAVKAHVSMLLETFGLHNRAQLSLLADHAGLRPPPSRSHA